MGDDQRRQPPGQDDARPPGPAAQGRRTGGVDDGFTRYLRSLDPAGAPPDVDAFEALWRKLRFTLRREVRRRGLWDSPPSYLGIHGWPRWQHGGRSQGAARESDALDELTADCYTFTFLKRLRSLRAQLALKPNIEGLVIRNVRNFIYERQCKHDPLGTRLFQMLRSAVRRTLRSRLLHLLRGDPKIANDTELGFAPDTAGSEPTPNVYRAVAKRWCDTLLPELVTARGQEQEVIIAELGRLLAQLPAAGIEIFSFKGLLDALKRDARNRWAALLEDEEEGETAVEFGDDGLGTVVRLIRPDTSLEEEQHFHALAGCVADGLEKIEASSITRRHLATLWQFLRTFALGPEEQSRRDGQVDAEVAEAADEEHLPSRRKLSQLLHIPRDRFTELNATLRKIIEMCRQAAISRDGAVIRWRGSATSAPSPASGSEPDA